MTTKRIFQQIYLGETREIVASLIEHNDQLIVEFNPPITRLRASDLALANAVFSLEVGTDRIPVMKQLTLAHMDLESIEALCDVNDIPMFGKNELMDFMNELNDLKDGEARLKRIANHEIGRCLSYRIIGQLCSMGKAAVINRYPDLTDVEKPPASIVLRGNSIYGQVKHR